MDTRKAYPTVLYNGKNISTTVDKYLESFQYTDPASGESDSISITLGNWDNNWLAGWFPDKGATLTAKVNAHNWRKEGEMLHLDCGTLLLDDISFTGAPDTMTMGAVSAPANDAFQTTERTKTWEDITIRQIAADIAKRYGLALVYDAVSIKIASVEQSKATDSAFLSTICKDYGLSLKVYSKKLVLFDREIYKSKGAVATIDKADMLNYTFNTTLAGTYTGGELTYTTNKGAEIVARLGDGPRILKSNVSASTALEAKRKLTAAIEEANHGETKMSFSTIGNPLLVAGQCINITGFGIADGKYYIDKATHSLGDAYTTAYECARVRGAVSSKFTQTAKGGGPANSNKLDSLAWATRTQAARKNT